MYGDPFENIPVEKLVALFRTANAMHTPEAKSQRLSQKNLKNFFNKFFVN